MVLVKVILEPLFFDGQNVARQLRDMDVESVSFASNEISGTFEIFLNAS